MLKKTLIVLCSLGALAGQAHATEFFLEGGWGLTQFSSSGPADYYNGVAGDFSGFSSAVDNFHGYFDTGLFLNDERRWSLGFGASFGPSLYATGSSPGYFQDRNDVWELFLEPMYHYRFGSSPWELSAGPHFGLTVFSGRTSYSSYAGEADWSSAGTAFSVGGLVNLRAYLGPDFYLDFGGLYQRADITNVNTTLTHAEGTVPDFSSSGVDLSGTTLRVGLGFVFGGPGWQEGGPSRRYRRRVMVRRLPEEETPGLAEQAEAQPQAASSDPAQVEARDRRLGYSELQAGHYPQAETAYRRAADEVPADFVAWKGLGNALYYEGRKAEALEAYDKALKLKPDADMSKFVERLRQEKE